MSACAWTRKKRREGGREGGKADLEEGGTPLRLAPESDVQRPKAIPVGEGGVSTRLREGGREGGGRGEGGFDWMWVGRGKEGRREGGKEAHLEEEADGGGAAPVGSVPDGGREGGREGVSE